MNYRNAPESEPTDYRIVTHKYRDRRGEWREEPVPHWDGWPGGAVDNCPYTVEQIREARQKAGLE